MKRFLAMVLAAVLSMGASATAFAAADDAYFFGDEEFLTEMENVEYHMDRMGYYTKIYTNPIVSRFTASRLNSSVLYVAGHGTKYSVDTGDDCGICIDGSTGYKDVSDSSFSRTEMAIMAACKTGRYTNDPTECLAGTIEDNGANFVLAWTGSPNTGILGDYTDRFAYYVRRGNKYLDAAINTREYLLSKGAYETSTVFDNILFGRVNDTLPEVATRAAKQEAKAAVNPVAAYLDDELNQSVVEETVVYNAGSSDFDEIEQYIQENVDADFVLDDYSIKEFGEEENGVNQISFRLKVNGVSSNYGFIVLCIDDEMKLITFTDNYEDATVDEIKNMPMAMADSNDGELLDMAISADGYDYEVDEQYIEKYFDVTEGKVVNAVNTVYVDENGGYFCTEHKF